MVLVDTSVWIDHLRAGDAQLATLLESGQVLCHPLIIGELACGHLRHRQALLDHLHQLPQAEICTHEEALVFIEKHSLMARGVGITDIMLLAAAVLSRAFVWSRDKNMAKVAHDLRLLWQ